MKETTYKTSFTIRSYEVGRNQKTTIPTIANLFQESAGLHAKKLTFDITDLYDMGITWVLYKMHIKVKAFPARWEDVWVKTWPSTGHDIRAFRSYEMTGTDGNLYAKALGQWMTLDLKSRRPVKIPEQLSHYPLLQQTGEKMNSDKKPLKPVDEKDSDFISLVGEYDLDMNNHVNSVRYIEWSAGYQKKKSSENCTEILIQHQAEALYGDSIYRSVDDSKYNRKVTLYNQHGKALSTALVTYS